MDDQEREVGSLNDTSKELSKAAADGNTELLDLLLKRLGDSAKHFIRAKCESGDTVLHVAVNSGNPEAVKRLLATLDDDQAKECIFANGPFGCNILHRAAEADIQRGLDMIKALVDKLTDDESRSAIAMKNDFGYTVLHFAVNHADKVAVDFLLSKLGAGAQEVLVAKNNQSRSILFLCVRTGCDNVFDLLATTLGDAAFKEEILQRDKYNMTLLHAAVLGGSPSIVQRLLVSLGEQVKDTIQSEDNRGNTVLDLALASDNPMVLDLLLKHEQLCNLDKEVFIGNGRTLLKVYAYSGNLEMLKVVVEALGCKRARYQALQKDIFGRTALHYATMSESKPSSIAVLEYLFDVLADKGSDAVKEQDNEGNTVLHHAAVSPANINILEFIVKKLAEEKALEMIKGMKNKLKNTILHVAVYSQNTHGVRILLTSLDPLHVMDTICKSDERGRTILHAAANTGNVDIFKMLISEVGREMAISVIGRVTDAGHTVLNLAADGGHVAIVQLIVKYLGNGVKGAIRQVSRNGRTVLHVSVRSGRAEVFEKLMTALEEEAQYELRRKDNEGATLLHASVQGGKVEILKSLVDALGDKAVDAFEEKDNNGNAPLHWAVDYKCCRDILQVLQPHFHRLLPLKNNQGLTALHLAAIPEIGMLKDVVDLAVEHGLTKEEILRHTTLHEACEIGSERLVEYLLLDNRGREDITRADENFLGNTAIHAAAIGGKLEVLHQLDGTYDVKSVRNWYGQTPLHFAVAQDNFQVGEWLINEKHCDPGDADFAGVTPLHFAVRGQASEAVLELLRVSLGPRFEENLNKETNAGLTPLHYAAWNGNIAAICWLIEKGVDLEAIDKTEKLTPCMWAAMGCHPNYTDSYGYASDVFSLLVNYYVNKGKNPLANEPELFDEDGFRVPAPNNLMDMMCSRILQANLQNLNRSLVSCALVYGDSTTAGLLGSMLRSQNKEDMSIVYDMVEAARPIQLAAMCSVEGSSSWSIDEFLSNITTDDDENKHLDVNDKLQLELESAFKISVKRKTVDRDFIRVLVRYMNPLRVRELLQQFLCEEIGVKESMESKYSQLGSFDKSRLINVNVLVKDIPLAYWIAYESVKIKNAGRRKEDIGPVTAPQENQTLQETISLVIWIIDQLEMTQAGTPDSQAAEMNYDIRDRYPNNVGWYTGRTALHWAVIFGKKNIVRHLCKDKKCERDIEDNFGKPPYWYATLHQQAFLEEEYNEFVNWLKWDKFYESLHKDRDLYVDGLNAILVGAALIATVTFAGVLTPPLGYPVKSSGQTSDLNYVAVYKPGVQIFWVCISLSFFFSMASALAGVTGVLPNISAFDLAELQRIRHLLMTAALYLVISIVFVLFAFGAAGFSVLPGALRLQANMIATTVLGGTFCIYRLLKFGKAVYSLTPYNWLKKMVIWLKPYFCREVERVEPKAGIKELIVNKPSKYVRGSIGEAILKANGVSRCTYHWDDGLWNAPFAAKLQHPPFIVCE